MRFESLDTKAGLLLGVSGVIVTMAPAVARPLLITSVAAVVLAGGFALASLWPRGFPMLDATRLSDYAPADPALTRRVLLDTAEEMVIEASKAIRRKTLRLKWSFMTLAIGGLTLAIGIAI
jgi:hypothetical protein